MSEFVINISMFLTTNIDTENIYCELPNSGKSQKKPSSGASNKCRIDEASMRAHKHPTLKGVAVYPAITVQYHHCGNFFTAHRKYDFDKDSIIIITLILVIIIYWFRKPRIWP
jgi:hypothetical protein